MYNTNFILFICCIAVSIEYMDIIMNKNRKWLRYKMRSWTYDKRGAVSSCFEAVTNQSYNLFKLDSCNLGINMLDLSELHFPSESK